MTLRRTHLLFVPMIVLLLGTLPGYVCAGTITVPDAECPPYPSGPLVVVPSCWNFLVDSCNRTDSEITKTGGSPALAKGEVFNCRNCGGCPETTPSSRRCEDTLEIEYSENITVTLADDSMKNAWSISLNLAGSIGHINTFFFTRQYATCGTSSLSGCKTQSFTVVMDVTEGIQAEMTHDYNRERIYRHRNLTVLEQAELALALLGIGTPTCSSCGESLVAISDMLDFPQTNIKTNLSVGSTKSTAVGSSFGEAITKCESGAIGGCD